MQTTTTNLADVTIPVSGLTCASCVGHVRDALESQPGVTAANVNLVTREAKVSFHPGDTSVETLVEAIRNRGYGAELPVIRASWPNRRPRRKRQPRSTTTCAERRWRAERWARLPWCSPCR